MCAAIFHPGPVLGLLLLSAPLWCSRVDVAAATEQGVTRPAAGVFLIARRGMPDPRFARTVVLLVDYGEEGALGLIVNRPTRMPLPGAFPGVEALQDSKQVLWFGGPVAADQAALLFDAPQTPAQSKKVMDTLHFSTSLEVLESLVTASRPSRYRVYAGYAGWAPAQLDGELARGDWHLREASVEQVMAADTRELWNTLIGAGGTWVRADDEPVPESVSYLED